MALKDYSLQAIDTFEVEMVVKEKDGSKYTLGSGETTKTELTQKVDSIEVRNGIGQKLRCRLKTKKENTLKVTVNNFDLRLFAEKNGVKLDTTSKKTLYWEKETSVTTASATITDATRILAVKLVDGTRLKMIYEGTQKEGEVKITGNKLDFVTGFSATQVLVTYEAPTTKDNYTVVFNAQSFAKSMELLCHSVVYAEETEDIVADVYYNFYKASLSDDYTWTFDGGKPTDLELDFVITAPRLLPDGTINSKGDTGVMYVTER